LLVRLAFTSLLIAGFWRYLGPLVPKLFPSLTNGLWLENVTCLARRALGPAQFMPGTAAWIAQLYPADLGEAAPLDARWALRALVTYDLWLWERLTEFRDDGLHRWGATLSAYNGGLGNVRKDRQLVYTERRRERAASRGGPSCDPAVSRWFCCVEHHSNRSAAAIRENREYPRRILFLLWPRYQAASW
jgi:hypothetical protein